MLIFKSIYSLKIFFSSYICLFFSTINLQCAFLGTYLLYLPLPAQPFSQSWLWHTTITKLIILQITDHSVMDSFHSMNRYVSPYVVYVEHNAQSTMLCNLPGMAFHVYFWVIPDVPPEYFIHQESSLPAKCLQQGQKLLINASLPLPIPSIRNHLVLLQSVFIMARISVGRIFQYSNIFKYS